MNNDELIQQLSEKNVSLELELQEIKEKLKKYTAPERNRNFYQNHKEEVLNKNKEYYKEKVTSEKRKEYARTAYLNKKGKEKQQAMKDQGYQCEIWVYDDKGVKIECYK